MNDFVQKNKGPLIVAGGATSGLVLLIIASAIINMPEDVSGLDILANLIWFVLIGAFCVGAVLYVREHYLDNEGYLGEEARGLEDPTFDQQTRNQPSIEAATCAQLVKGERSLTEDQIENLFGTTDMNQITKSVEAMYGELKQLRANSDQGNEASQEEIINALTSERDQVKAQSEKWKTKAISSTQEVTKLRQELAEKTTYTAVDEEELADFFPTVTLSDRETEEPFLSSKRRQRRLFQRLSAEGYLIVKDVK